MINSGLRRRENDAEPRLDEEAGARDAVETRAAVEPLAPQDPATATAGQTRSVAREIVGCTPVPTSQALLTNARARLMMTDLSS